MLLKPKVMPQNEEKNMYKEPTSMQQRKNDQMVQQTNTSMQKYVIAH